MDIIPDTLEAMEASMDIRMAQQRVISANLANVDTPGYKAQKLDFEASLQNALDGQVDPLIIEQSTTPALSLDGNNVDMEGELGNMSRNKTMYNLTAQLIAAKLREISQVISQEP